MSLNILQKFMTADKSETFLNEQVGECYHSIKGAVEEVQVKYIIPCKIREIAKKNGKLCILDVCFGMGYNSSKAISEALAENPDCEIEVVGLEYDPEIISKIQEVNPEIPFFVHYKKLVIGSLEFQEGKVKVKVILGDACETVKELPANYFDAVFFDPFSPKTAPEMWQVPFFEQMHRVMKNSAILATFSCARMARDNMGKAGLVYDDGPIWGRRGPGTIATKWV